MPRKIKNNRHNSTSTVINRFLKHVTYNKACADHYSLQAFLFKERIN